MPSVKEQTFSRQVKTAGRPEQTASAGIGDLLLRLVGGNHHGRIIRIHAVKCTVGSAPGCTLRLKAPGIEPVHALIMRGPQGAIIRRYGERLEINEAEVDDASLRAGDRLRIGPVEMTVLGANATQEDMQLATSPAATKMQKAFQEHVRQTRRAGHQRLKRILQSVRQQRQQIGELFNATDRRKMELERLAQQLSSLQRELTQERERQLAGDQQQRSALLQVDQLTHSLERLRQDFLAAQSRHRQESDHWRLDQSRLTEDIVERDRRLHLLQGELAQRQWDLDQLGAQLKRAQRQVDLESEQHEATRERMQREAEVKQAENAELIEELHREERLATQTRQDLILKQREFDQLKQLQDRTQRELNQERAALLAEQQARHNGGSQWERERHELRSDLQLRESQVEQLEANLQQQTTVATELRRELEKCRDTLSSLRSQSAAAQQAWELDRMKIIAQVSDAAAQDAQLVAGKQTVIEELHAKLVAAENELAKRQEELEQANEDMGLLRAEAQTTQSAWEWERKRLMQLVDERDRQLEAAKDSEERLELRLLDLQTSQQERDRLQRELTRQREEYDRQCGEIRELRAAQTNTKVQHTLDESELKSISRTCEDLRIELAKQTSAVEVEREVEARLTAEIERLAGEVAAWQQELQTVRGSLESTQLDLEAARTDLDAARGNFEAAQQELAGSQESLQTTRVELQESRAAQCHLQTEVERLTAELEKANTPPPMQTMVMPQSFEPAIDESAVKELEVREEALNRDREEMQKRQAELEEQGRWQAEREVEITRLHEELQARTAHVEAEKNSLQEAAARLEQVQVQLASERAEVEALKSNATAAVENSRADVQLEATVQEANAACVDQVIFDVTAEAPATPIVAQTLTIESLRAIVDEVAATSEFVSEPVEATTAPQNADDWSAAERELRAIMSDGFDEAPAAQLQSQEQAEEQRIESPIEPTQSPAEATIEAQEIVVESPPVEVAQEPAASTEEDRFLMPTAWNEQPAEAATPVIVEPAEPTAAIVEPEAPAPQFVNDDLASPFPDFSADDLATALGDATSNPSSDANVPKPLPDEASSQNLLEGPEFSPAHQSQPGPVLPLSPVENPSGEVPDNSPTTPANGDSDADIFARLRAAGIVKDDMSPATAIPEMPERSFDAAAEGGIVSQATEDSLADALRNDIAPASANGLSSSRFLPNVAEEEEAALPPPSFSRPAPAQEGSEDEESIESYMQQLLTRVRGDSPPTGTGPNPVYRAAAAPAPTREAEEKPVAPPKPVAPVTKEEYIPRSQAPEQSMSLAAMREVANSQARAAIQTHAKKVGKKQSSGRFAAAAAAIVLGVPGLIWGLQTHSLPATAGGGISLIVGLFWAGQALWLARGVTARGKTIEQPGAKKEAAEKAAD